MMNIKHVFNEIGMIDQVDSMEVPPEVNHVAEAVRRIEKDLEWLLPKPGQDPQDRVATRAGSVFTQAISSTQYEIA
jgi:hypothetical protein